MWNKVTNASQYSIQVSDDQTFTDIPWSSSTSDTTKTFSGLSEGQSYYWRIQASNLSGSGPWSDVLEFSTLSAPTNLVLERSATNEITLTWEDNAESEDGFVIERKVSPDTSFTLLDTLKGSGNTYIDTIATEQSHTYTYRVKAYNSLTASNYSNEASILITDVDKVTEIPTEYSVSQNYPNPFNPSTKIKFTLPQTTLVKLTIYNVLGKVVQILINRELEAGYHEINFDAGNFPSGVYLYRIQSGNFIQTKKMILMK